MAAHPLLLPSWMKDVSSLALQQGWFEIKKKKKKKAKATKKSRNNPSLSLCKPAAGGAAGLQVVLSVPATRLQNPPPGTAAATRGTGLERDSPCPFPGACYLHSTKLSMFLEKADLRQRRHFHFTSGALESPTN